MAASLPLAASLGLLLALLAAPGAAPADEIYRWVDKEGNVHFGEAPPAGKGAKSWEGGPRERLTIVPRREDASEAAPASQPPARRAPAARDESQEEPARKIAGRYEWQWRNQGRQYQGRIDAVEAKLQREHERSASTWGSSLSAARWEARQQIRIEELERDLVAAEGALDEFEEYARESGVPPGWLR